MKDLEDKDNKSIIVKDRITNPRGEYYVYKRRMTEAKTSQESAWNGDRACEIGIGILSTKLDGDAEFKKKFDEISNEFDKLEVFDEIYGVQDSNKPTNTVLIDKKTRSCYSEFKQFDSFGEKNKDIVYRKYLNKMKVILKNIECLMFQKKINKWEDAIIEDGVTAESIRQDVERKDRFR